MQEDAASDVDEVVEEPDLDEGWVQLEEAPIAADAEDLTCIPCGDVVQDDEGVASQIHRSLPEPKPPSREDVRKHNLTHWPYRSLCPWCVMGRRNADPHFQAKGADDRYLPLLVLDYAFLRDKEDDDSGRCSLEYERQHSLTERPRPCHQRRRLEEVRNYRQ